MGGVRQFSKVTSPSAARVTPLSGKSVKVTTPLCLLSEPAFLFKEFGPDG
jgi:hypothetical protein